MSRIFSVELWVLCSCSFVFWFSPKSGAELFSNSSINWGDRGCFLALNFLFLIVLIVDDMHLYMGYDPIDIQSAYLKVSTVDMILTV